MSNNSKNLDASYMEASYFTKYNFQLAKLGNSPPFNKRLIHRRTGTFFVKGGGGGELC